ncbi:hypothetical protein A2999_00150 [Candidatus Wolfebacteria bacterium RIFCSPLOWO2_01_FULL_38_11]|uniref:Uncharacterized protein n=1 Tax=Candidatus Wolfebacteria bacterium RIFCSPLOWO2_01_FULL_38_11 TaxID=1802556 RepID=A0A1F8DP30_9BACT|nr:MAG: hypothetical protein A2999_00150 [Candidatus Wolfebacteria bacterium RIFCSPLOWO2_01_FULL_38_11]
MEKEPQSKLDVKEFAKGQLEALGKELFNALLFITACLVRPNGGVMIIGANGTISERLPLVNNIDGTFITYVMLTQYDGEQIVAVGLIGRMSDSVKEVISLIVGNMKELGIESVFLPGYLGYSSLKVPMTHVCRGSNLDQQIIQIKGPVFFDNNNDTVLFTHGKDIIEVPMREAFGKLNWSAVSRRIGEVSDEITALARGADSSLIINTTGKFYTLNLEEKKVKPFSLPAALASKATPTFFTFTESKKFIAALYVTGQLTIERAS